jgi:hypothetical protein
MKLGYKLLFGACVAANLVATSCVDDMKFGNSEAKLNLKNFDQILDSAQKQQGQTIAKSILLQYKESEK